jgi:hypothetical protein
MTGQPRTGLPFERNAMDRAVGRRDDRAAGAPRARGGRERDEQRRRLAAAADAVGERLQQVGIVVHVHRPARLARRGHVVGHAQAQRHGEAVGRVRRRLDGRSGRLAARRRDRTRSARRSATSQMPSRTSSSGAVRPSADAIAWKRSSVGCTPQPTASS